MMDTSTPDARATSDSALVKEKRRYRMLDDALIEQIANFVKITGAVRTACEAAGVSWETARWWLKQAKLEREPYLTFRTKVRAAKALREVGLHYTVQQHAMTTKESRGSWQAAMAELNRIEWQRRAREKNAPPPKPPEEDAVIVMYPVRVHEGPDGVRLEPIAVEPARIADAYDTQGEDVTDADE